MKRLLDEIRDANAAGNLSPIVSWKESRQLPYLDACIKEAGRLHPPFGLNLERVVPLGGLEVCGQHLPAGTVVGMNGWVVHRDRDVFGQDASSWRPERWLEGDEENIKKMEASLLTVSALQSPLTKILFSCLYAEVHELSSLELATASAWANTSPFWRYTNLSLLSYKNLRYVLSEITCKSSHTYVLYTD